MLLLLVHALAKQHVNAEVGVGNIEEVEKKLESESDE